MTWAQRLKQVFNIDMETCQSCGGAMKVIACIEDPDVIQKILTYLDSIAPETASTALTVLMPRPKWSFFDEPWPPVLVGVFA